MFNVIELPSTSMSKKLMQFVIAPSRVAKALDWGKGSILAVDVGTDRMGLAVASHPARSLSAVRTLEPLDLKLETLNGNRRALSKNCVQSLASIVRENNIKAFVFNWPIQSEGRCGAAAGKVLHTVESLLEQSHSIVTKRRPICLWDNQHVESKLPQSDSFGRDPIYGNCTSGSKTLHVASKEQYKHHECSSHVAAKVWQDFCQSHWSRIHEARNGDDSRNNLSSVGLLAQEEEFSEGGEAIQTMVS